MSAVVVVNLQARKGMANEALQVIRKSQKYCLTVDGCGAFEVLQSKEDVHHFVFVERWASIEKHKALLSSLMSTPDVIESLKMFSAGPDIEYFNSL